MGSLRHPLSTADSKRLTPLLLLLLCTIFHFQSRSQAQHEIIETESKTRIRSAFPKSLKNCTAFAQKNARTYFNAHFRLFLEGNQIELEKVELISTDMDTTRVYELTFASSSFDSVWNICLSECIQEFTNEHFFREGKLVTGGFTTDHEQNGVAIVDREIGTTWRWWYLLLILLAFAFVMPMSILMRKGIRRRRSSS